MQRSGGRAGYLHYLHSVHRRACTGRGVGSSDPDDLFQDGMRWIDIQPSRLRNEKSGAGLTWMRMQFGGRSGVRAGGVMIVFVVSVGVVELGVEERVGRHICVNCSREGKDLSCLVGAASEG